MNLNNIVEFNSPFQHWEVFDCLDENTLEEIINVKIPEGERSYDGTRAADHTGGGIDGKLRLFITKNNSDNFPNLTKLIKKLQTYETYSKISKLLGKNLSDSFVRVEVISDKKGFWLKPHRDISEKLMTMLIWQNPYNESIELGTDFYDKNKKVIKTVKYIHNNGYFFTSDADTWHGLELKEIKKERRCVQINYVTFNTDWPVQK